MDLDFDVTTLEDTVVELGGSFTLRSDKANFIVCDHGDYTDFKWALDVDEDDVKYLRPEYVAYWKSKSKAKGKMPKAHDWETCHLRAMPVICPITKNKPKVHLTGKLSKEEKEAISQVLTHLGFEVTSFVK